MSPQPKKRPEDEAPEAESTAASETSEDTSAESAAADPSPAEETATSPQGDPVGEEALAAAPDSEEKPAAKKKAPAKKRAAKKKAAAKAQPTATEETPTEVAEEPVAEEPAAPKATPPVRKRDLPREPGQAVVVRAQAKYVRSSARKARLVCDGIRGKSVADAKSILAFHPRHVAEAWEKLLDSAIANAENNHELDVEDLKVHAVYADEGPTIKRFRPRAHGRATQIRKRTSHLSIQLTTKGD